MGADEAAELDMVLGEELRRDAPSLEVGREPAGEVEARREEELTVREAAGAVPVDDALAARPMIGGGAGAEAVTGFEAAGFCQDEKKSSSSPVAPPEAGLAVASAVPSTTIRVGNLCVHSSFASDLVEKIRTLLHRP